MKEQTSNGYLIYARRSTDEAESQKNSLDYQRSEALRYATAKNLPIANLTIKGFSTNGIISEKHSGFKASNNFRILKDGMIQYHVDRPKFYEMMRFLLEGKVKGIIVLCWDRISRNRADDALVEKLIDRGIDIHFIHTKYERSSSGALHMYVDSMFASHHSRVTGEKVRLAVREKRSQGAVIGRAPLGYLNHGQDSKPLDPIRAPIVKRIFELYGTGSYSLADLVRFATKEGLTTIPARRRRTKDERLSDIEVDIPKVSRLLTFNSLREMLGNPFYTGVTMGNDRQWIKSNAHEALVSKELFNKIQSMLKRKKNTGVYKSKIPLPYRSVVRCACGRVYTPYVQKGKLYFYSRCIKGCTNTTKSFSQESLECMILHIMSKLIFTDDELEQIGAHTKDDFRVLDIKRQSDLERIDRSKKKLREDLSYLAENKISLLRIGTYTPEALLEEEHRISSAIASLQVQEEVSDISMSETVKEVINNSELLKTLYTSYKDAFEEEKEQILKKVFSELIFSENILTFQCNSTFKSLETRFSRDVSLLRWLSELCQVSPYSSMEVSNMRSLII